MRTSSGSRPSPRPGSITCTSTRSVPIRPASWRRTRRACFPRRASSPLERVSLRLREPIFAFCVWGRLVRVGRQHTINHKGGRSMPTVTTPQELFEHELQDMYYAEKTLINVLPKLAEEATDSELSRAFTSHLKQTEKHAKNLEGVFRSIGKAPQAHPCPGIEGIKKEHDEFV